MNESNFDQQVGLRGNRQWGDEVRSSLQHHSDIRHADTWKVTWLWFLSVTVQFKRGWHWKVTWLWFLSVTVQFKRGWQWGNTWNPPTPTTASLITCSKTRSTPPSLDRKLLQRREKKTCECHIFVLYCLFSIGSSTEPWATKSAARESILMELNPVGSEQDTADGEKSSSF